MKVDVQTRTSKYDRVTTWLAPQFHEMYHVSVSQGRMSSKHDTRGLKTAAQSVCKYQGTTSLALSFNLTKKVQGCQLKCESYFQFKGSSRSKITRKILRMVQCSYTIWLSQWKLLEVHHSVLNKMGMRSQAFLCSPWMLGKCLRRPVLTSCFKREEKITQHLFVGVCLRY